MATTTMDSPDLLAHLPIELLLRITRHLSTTDLCSVRLTSRGIERALFHSFSNEFFRRKQFMLSDFSLQALLDIAQHPALGPTLRHVSIGLDKFTSIPIHNFGTEQQAIWYQTAAAQQLSLVSTGRGVELLAAAFAHLPNLETVDLRDFYSRTRFRDGAHHPWSSYGVRRIAELSGDVHTSLTNGHDARFATTVFSLVLSALAKAGARPQNLEVLLRTRTRGLSEHAFDLTTSNPASLLGVITGLRRLHVDIGFHGKVFEANIQTVDFRGNRFQPTTVAGLPFHAFLTHASNVEWLRINMQNASVRSGDIFLDYLGKPLPPSYPFVSSPSFSTSSPFKTLPPRLRRLDLGHTAASPANLLALLRRIPALQALSLWSISLEDPDNTDRPSTVWKYFLQQLADDTSSLLAHLHEFTVGSAHERTNSIHVYPVHFSKVASCTLKAEATETMQKDLGILATVAETLMPKVEPNNGGGGDDEDESMTDEDEGEETDDDIGDGE